MKLILMATIFTVLSLCTFGQEIHSGTYFTTKKDIGFESDIFQFQEDGTFSHVLFTCTGTGLGKGRYDIISGDSLRLQFSDCIKCESVKQVDMFTELSDSLETSLTVREWADGSELSGVNVSFPEEGIGIITDERGQANFKTSISRKNRTLQIQYVGYDPIDLEVPANTSQLTGKIYLTWHWIYDSSDTKTYKILKWTRSKLKLERYPDLAVTYDKVSHRKTDKLIEDRMGKNGYKLYLDKIKMLTNESYK